MDVPMRNSQLMKLRSLVYTSTSITNNTIDSDMDRFKL